MDNELYQFKIGQFDCTLVSDGTFAYPHPAQVMFAGAPQDRLEELLRNHGIEPGDWETYVSPYPSLLINTGDNLVLVDTGAGGFAPTNGKLMISLAAAGVKPEMIDTVILTHGHADHIGGNVDTDGKIAFPNARFFMWKEEWEFWTTDPDLSPMRIPDDLKHLLIEYANRQLPPIQDRLTLVETEMEIVPGIHAIAAPGHTPGHMALAVVSDGKQLLNIVDTVIHPIHLEQPTWTAAVDLLPSKTVETRRRLLQRAVSEKALVFAYHFPSPGLGHVISVGDSWQWQPIDD